jgi:hypothetical protein
MRRVYVVVVENEVVKAVSRRQERGVVVIKLESEVDGVNLEDCV